MSAKPKLLSTRLHPQEFALISLIRKLNCGTIDKISVSNGLPQVVLGSVQRIDLAKEEERIAVFQGRVSGVFDMEHSDSSDPQSKNTEGGPVNDLKSPPDSVSAPE